MHVKQVVFFFIFMTSASTAQDSKWILDSIYTHSISLKNSNILYNQDESFIIDKLGKRQYHPIQSHKALNLDRDFLVKIEGLVYYLAFDQPINLEEAIEMDFRNLTRGGSQPDVIGKTIVYNSNDSVFVDNFSNPGKTWILKNMYPFMYNETYLKLEEDSSDDVFIYNFKNNKLSKIPHGKGGIEVKNKDFILRTSLNRNFEFTIDVYDLNLNKIVNSSEGYTQLQFNEDILALYGGKKEPKVWYNGKSIKLPPNIIYIDILDKTNTCIIKNKQGYYGIINENGKLAQPMKYDYCASNSLYDTLAIATKGNYSYVIDRMGNEIFKGEYEKVKYLIPDYFRVESNNSLAIVNSKKEFIIPFIKRTSRSFNPRLRTTIYCINPYGKQVIQLKNKDSYSLYTLEGELIIKFKIIKKEPRCSTDQYYQDGCNWTTIRGLSDTQIAQLNPSNLWKRSKKYNGEWITCLENNYGEKRTKWHKRIRNIPGTNRYVIQTMSDKYGVQEFSN